MKQTIILIILLTLWGLPACRQEEKARKKKAEKESTENNQAEEKAREWLIATIEKTFNSAEPDFAKITTQDYYDYKNDAISLDYRDSLKDAEFNAKWMESFDPQYAGKGTGFLVPTRDWGKIKVTRCLLTEWPDEESFVFEIIIRDTELKVDYRREIRVTKNGESFLIADVKEF